MSIETKSNQNWLMDRFLLAMQFLVRVVYEPFRGAWNGEPDAIWHFAATCLMFTIFILGLDGKILFYYGKGNVYDHKLYTTLQFFVGILPLICYGTFHAALRTMFILELRKSFDRSGLQNALKEYPSFIGLEAKDNESLKLRLTNNGMSISDWKSKKERIEANLRVYIDNIEMVQDKGIIEITFSSTPMPQYLAFDHIDHYRGYKFQIGKSRTGFFEIDFTKDPHLLVAGESGGGKTYFIRQMIATLKYNHPETVIKLFDLKASGDFNCFANVDRVELQLTPESAPAILAGVVTEIQSRAEMLRNHGVSDLGSYHLSKKFGEKTKEQKLQDPCGHRIFVVVDEFAELVLSSGKLNSEGIKATRESLSKISRLGRSCGVHLVLTTQRPDRSIVDVQVKSNMTSTVCFRLNDLGGSLAVLGSKTACELPQIKGRAIYLRGSDEHEIQTPFLSEEGARKLMEHQMKQEGQNGPSINV
jgi:S-DNA-T family DNA segregation ATPase FtsK/SpoIIIE